MPHSEINGAAASNATSSAARQVRERARQRVLNQFQSEQALSMQLLANERPFRELCEEYDACCDAIERLGSTSFDAELRKEYLDLRGQLEEEVADYLADRRADIGNR